MIQHTATVPLHIINNRPFIDGDFLLPDGQSHTARCWLDTGGGALIITERLAHLLSAPFKKRGKEFATTLLPPLSIGGLSIDLTTIQTLIALNQQTLHADAEVFCGGMLLGQYHLVFDYPQHQFTIALPEHHSLPEGTPLPILVHPQSRFPRVEVQIDGTAYGMLLDTGATHTMISQTLIDQWAVTHPAWQISPVFEQSGDYAENREARELHLPSLQLGPYQIEDVHAVSRPAGTFEQFLSQWMAKPVIGALGGNVLQQFRCEIDYTGETLYLTR